ncbi:acyl-peptide hydrolase [Planktosalinus lacus]|uniref:Acyl-peptide hydrolase n=2 Tax=Planktosalinus lacus TaxID=1526573 RepID=A0A8J2V9I4_9FLAO|nr:acyl-peptide hydrolase [Planktosalinus lacus]
MGLMCILFLSSLTLSSQNKTPFDYLDVFEMQYAAQPEISPDGSQIVYLRNQFDIKTDKKFTNLWLIDYDGTSEVPLTSGKQNYSNAKWSPDGEKIAYVSAEEGSSQIFVRWMKTGQTASITNLTKSPGNLSWSPDGKWIAFTMFVPSEEAKIGKFPGPPEGAEWAKPAKIIDKVNYRSDGNFGFVESGFRHLFVVSANGGAARQITFGDFNHSTFSWMPDGKTIIVSANREENAELNPNNSHLYKVNTLSNSIAKITTGKGPYQSPKVSPDGKKVLFSHYEDKFVGYQLSKIFHMNPDGSQVTEIKHNLGLDIDDYEWDRNSKSLFIKYTKHGEGVLASMDLNGNTTNITSKIGSESYGRPYSSGSFSIAKNGNYVFTQASTSRPAELAVGKYPSKTEAKRITSLNDNFLINKTIGDVEEIWFKSSYDNKEVQGWIIYPPDFDASKKYPLILEIHGGPYLSYGPHFTPELQLMATQGYVVLYTNPRGSTSYGEEFAAYINNNYPSEDYDDLMSGIDAVIAKGFINTDRLYITGGSGGGVLSSWSIGKTDRFAAAVVSKPVINWYSFALTSDGGSIYYQYWFNKKPWEDPDQYLDHSPISLVGNVNTPAMIICGENDYRTPMSESEQYYNALKIQGKEAMLVRIPEASHGITARPSNIIRQVGYIVGWFDKHQ